MDGDACPVREETYRVAARLKLNVFVVSNGSRLIRPPRMLNVSMVLVGDSADAADDWIAEHSPLPMSASRPISRWHHAASKLAHASSHQPEDTGRKRILVMRLPGVK